MAGKKPKLAEVKTKPTGISVMEYIAALPTAQKRQDSLVLAEMMEQASGEEPVLWGSSIIGFGSKRYESPASGRQVDWFRIGFAARKANLTIYLIDLKKHETALQKLGKHTTGGGCLYINKLADIDLEVLRSMMALTLA
ncbi:DUF1801 domain-containing protein [Mucilaginibacter sabulilitoris]|uniref:DUF1801 domain-containing protein n=1 Tax=Mucilaginibacter sabulilitoris TaxID=1173583 RepID=A0ABZ0TG37_9SPHI|nr:DUF1801 domain-containing protein [Mucilaginibacter sabulilitoris]WPU91551.1 DUF1801 domain-containing protein [Mucilaginibacter sabulilitoris]